MHGEHSVITWGTTKIPFEVRRSSRRNTVSLMVEPGAGLVVTAPERASITKLGAVVKSKARWVVDRLRRASEVPPPVASREFVSGETFFYLGRQCRLRVLPRAGPAAVALRAGLLEVTLPAGLDRNAAAAIRVALVRWYERRAALQLARWATPYINKMKVARAEVIIADQTKRWGSCSTGVLRINWRVIQAPRAIVEYVLAHEAVHLVHEHHDSQFWSELGRIMPDYDDRKARLRQIGPELVW